jgi:hypothetical protein
MYVTFTSPQGDKHAVWAFWDGGRTWRVRYSPDFPGKWKFETRCSDLSNEGLNNLNGEFICSASTDESVFDQHGPVQVARDHYHLEHADHTSFFYLADNVNRAALLSTAKEWEFYGLVRAKQNFTAAQWVATTGAQWEKLPLLVNGQPNVDYFKALDAKVTALNRDGILDAIVPFGFVGVADTGVADLSDDQAIMILRYMLARWSANDVAWVMPCDSSNGERWKKIGHMAFSNISHAPVILVADSATQETFRNEPWVDVFGSQSVTNAPTSKEWKKYPPRPSINVAPAFENTTSGDHRINAEMIRHTAGWNLLATPTAGIGYGAESVWNWDARTNANSGAALANWQLSLYLPGAKQLGAWAGFFNSIDFGRLRPAPELVVNQPGAETPGHFISSSITDFGDMALLYLPEGGDVEVSLKALPKNLTGSWVNGSTGEKIPTAVSHESKTVKLSAPGAGDWFLLIQAAKK